MYKKIYTIYNEGAVFCYFFIFRCKGVFAWGWVIFSKTELAEVGEAPQCYKIFNWLCCILCCCHDSTLWLSMAPCAGQKWDRSSISSIHCYLSKATTTQTFVNCMQQNGKLYHYFEIVYVKVIFLHVDCCYFVF